MGIPMRPPLRLWEVQGNGSNRAGSILGRRGSNLQDSKRDTLLEVMKVQTWT